MAETLPLPDWQARNLTGFNPQDFHLGAVRYLSSVRHDAERGRYQVSFKLNDRGELRALLTPAALQAMALQCLALMPEIEPKYTVACVVEAFRRPARVFKLYDDLSIQHFLREVQVETLNDFLWYMKDRELIMTVVNNMSSRAAESLVQDLENVNFGHRNAFGWRYRRHGGPIHCVD
jgi:hypothetical protein